MRGLLRKAWGNDDVEIVYITCLDCLCNKVTLSFRKTLLCGKSTVSEQTSLHALRSSMNLKNIGFKRTKKMC